MTSRREFDVAVVGIGGIGSGALYWASKRVGEGTLGLERFELGHERGASQDHSRIIRLSYHTPSYVRFAQDAYAAWAVLEADAGKELIVRCGGIDLFPEGGIISKIDYTRSLDACGIGYELMDAAEAMKRWPQWQLTDDVEVMFQEDAGIAPAAMCNDAHQRMARERGATMIDNARVTSIRPTGGGYELETEGARAYAAERLILAADAWTNELLAHFGHRINLTVLQEQVAYYQSFDLGAFAPERFPIWIWMDDPSYYGFPAYGEAGAKIGQDAGGREVTGDTRSFEVDPEYLARLDGFMQQRLPGGYGPHIKVKTCLYTTPPDRDFVLDFVPGERRAVVGQGAAHAFKFASAFGKSLVELVFDGRTESDVSAFGIEREVLTMEDPPRSFIV